jgi:hypothetical protein
MTRGRKPTTALVILATIRAQEGALPAGIQSAIPIVVKYRTTLSLLCRLVKSGRLFVAGPKYRRRYFTEASLAATWDAENDEATRALAAKKRKREYAKKRYHDRECEPSFSSRTRVWTPELVALMARDYPAMGPTLFAASIGLTASAVTRQASKLGIKWIRPPAAPKPIREPRKVNPLRKSGSDARQAAPAKRGPAWLPGELHELPRSPGFRHVIFPSMPQPTRSNTHSTF